MSGDSGILGQAGPGKDHHESIQTALRQRQATLSAAIAWLHDHPGALAEAARRLLATLRNGHKVMVAGNGGSAAEAQHFAAELVGRFKRERVPFAVLSLATDTSILTAVGNDYGFQYIFARQILAFGRPGDLLVAFSTSGESENLIRAAEAARDRRIGVLAITGGRPSRLEHVSDLALCVPTTDTAITQELHLLITHVLCDVVESELIAWNGDEV